MKITKLHFFVVLHIVISSSESSNVHLQVDVNHTIVNLTHFWESTGFCPPQPHQNSSEWFLSDDMTQNLIYISSVPFSGIKQVRMHWLLDTVKVVGQSGNTPVYNFEDLDVLIDQLWQLRLKPGFEVMGNPSNFFTDMENKTQVYLWKDLVHQIAARYVDRYGLGYVGSWNFEVWNEPDNRDFDSLNFTIQGFLNYVDACAEGLKEVSSTLKVGVPGGSCKDRYEPTKFCWATLNHVQNGTNYFTGEQGIQVAFLSLHEKGTEPSNTETILMKELEVYKIIEQHLPKLSQVPYFNDEGDPLVGWSSDLWWRADVTYAAMVTKVLAVHQNRWLSVNEGVKSYALLSNDNGFLSYNPFFFTQRTLTARFQMNNTSPKYVEFIRKPILSVMGLLSYLGEIQVNAQITVSGIKHYTKDSIGSISTIHIPHPYSLSDSWQAVVIIYYSEDTYNITGTVVVNISVTNAPRGDLMFVIYQLNNIATNPYAEWQNQGRPKTPTPQNFMQMREKENPVRLNEPRPLAREEFQTPLYLPGVNLLHICAKAAAKPDQVTNINIHNITAGKVLISWDDGCVNTKCISTYEVYCSTARGGPFARINANYVIFNTFVFSGMGFAGSNDEEVTGFYKIRAVDYWNRAGEYSMIVQYPPLPQKR